VASVVAVLAWLGLQMLVVQVFTVTAASMQPGLTAGQHVVVLRPTVDRPVRPGDVVVADVRGTFVPGQRVSGPLAGTVLSPAPEDVYVVKRVIAGPGDRIACCDPAGRLVLNERPLDEPYLPAGQAASQDEFDVLVPADRWWLMGDNREVSEDSRAHLGSPGGGTVPSEAVLGRVVGVWG